jgi:hypothetical protein
MVQTVVLTLEKATLRPDDVDVNKLKGDDVVVGLGKGCAEVQTTVWLARTMVSTSDTVATAQLLFEADAVIVQNEILKNCTKPVVELIEHPPVAVQVGVSPLVAVAVA